MIPLSTSKMQRCIAAAALATVLGLSGCSDDSSRNTTPDGTSADDTSAPEGTGGSTAGPAITEPGANTSAPAREPGAEAEARVQAALDSLPVEWSGTIASDLGEEGNNSDDIVFVNCLTPADYDLDNLDLDSAASWELDATGPAASVMGGQRAALEARVFTDPGIAADAYAVLERIVGTDDGRECLEAEVPGQLAANAPADAVLDARVEGTTIEGADVGARIVVTFTSQGFSGEFYVDLVAAHPSASTTIFATFLSFGTPVDQEVASAAMLAALAG